MLPHNELGDRLIMNMPMPEEHREIWRWLLDNQKDYPRDVFIPPFKRPSRTDSPRILAVCELIVEESARVGFPKVLAIRYTDRWEKYEIELRGDAEDARRITNLLFRFRRRGWLTVFRYGNARDFRILCQQYVRGIIALGFRVQPINAGSELIALKARKGGHTWQLIDFERATGVSPNDLESTCQSMNGVRCACYKCLDRALDALHTIQDYLVAKHRVCLKATIGSASIRAAAYHLPPAVWKWRPHPLLVTMCRLAGAFRGGIINGRGYRGPAWLVDTNRMYTWALTRELPLRTVIAPSTSNGILRAGVYVVSIFGPGSIPIYVPMWRVGIGGFSVGYWRGDAICSVLPTSEIEGIRNLGYRIETGIGFQCVQTFNLAKYVEALLEGYLEYGRNSLIGRTTKPMGNSVYGKFGEAAVRTDAVFSTDRPGDDYFPFLDSNGDEIDFLWERQIERYNSHQHVDIAAMITGYGRTHMYNAMASIVANGGIIAATNTDSIITNKDPKPFLEMDDTKIGKWREVAYDPDGITTGRNSWAIGEHIALAGAPNASRASLELMARGKNVVLHGIRKAPLSPGGPIAEGYSFTSATIASIGDQGSTPR